MGQRGYEGVSRRTRSCVLGLLAALAGAARGHFAMPTSAPVDRLVANLEAYTAEHPRDAFAFYSLGRVHSLAFTLKTRHVAAYIHEPFPPRLAGDWDQNWLQQEKREEAALTQAELDKHLTDSITAFNRAIDLDGANGVFHLSLACLLEAGRRRAGELAVAPLVSGVEPLGLAPAPWITEMVQAELEGATHDDGVRRWLGGPSYEDSDPALHQILRELLEARSAQDDAKARRAKALLKYDWEGRYAEEYFVAFSCSLPEHSLLKEQPLGGVQRLTSYEAGKNYIRVVSARGATEWEQWRLALVERTLRAYDDLPPCNAITPIIFSPDGADSLQCLLAPENRVGFDLDATGRPQSWPWIKPETALLVWDPDQTGVISSGRQLFGSVTWWVLFADGYRALDALDDNRDGWLRADELVGIAAWFDRNSDGVSDPGEVVSLASLNIEGISCRATSMDGDSPMNSAGLVLTGGRTLPTYDWVTRPVAERQVPLVVAAR